MTNQQQLAQDLLNYVTLSRGEAACYDPEEQEQEAAFLLQDIHYTVKNLSNGMDKDFLQSLSHMLLAIEHETNLDPYVQWLENYLEEA